MVARSRSLQMLAGLCEAWYRGTGLRVLVRMEAGTYRT